MDETGVPALDALLVWGGAATVLAGVGTLLWRGARGAARFGRRVDELVDDWMGEQERPGVPGRPGVLERVSQIEARLGAVEHELYPNSGASLRDAVDRANERLVRLCPDPDDPGEPTSPAPH